MIRTRLCAAALVLLAAACGDWDAPASVEVEDALEVHIKGDGGRAPTWYRAILTDDTGAVSAISCPSDEPRGPIACTAAGLRIPDAVRPIRLTVKARGYAFATHEFGELEPRDDQPTRDQLTDERVEVRLAALAPFESSALYATGFGGTEEDVAFDDLAIPDRTELGRAISLKFYIDGLDREPRVYFQNTKRFPRHFDFVQQGLGLPISAPEFEARTQGPERTAMVGTLISRPEVTVPEDDERSELSAPVTLEFFPSDDLSPAQALVAHHLLEERMQFLPLDGDEERLIYVPASDRAESELTSETPSFAQEDAGFARFTDLYAGVKQQILNPGSSYGTLRLFTPEELAQSVVSWRDILVLTRLPNDLPLVGGTITEELQTPLAHVNLAARARGTPNVALLGAAKDPKIAPFLDRLVRFEVTSRGFTVEGATLEEAEAFWASQARDPLVPESDTEFTGLPSFDEIGFLDAVRVGVKAANLAELHQLLGDRAPRGFAVPFSAYDGYMRSNVVTEEGCSLARTECDADGRDADLCDGAEALCQSAAAAGDSLYAMLERMLSDASFASDTALREASLACLRALIARGEVEPELASALEARTAELFGAETVRLRSSTNAEDLEAFSGAGLYDSVSAEAAGPRPVSSRIREVWASTWTFAAFEERSLWNVSESAVRMGVAVNQAFGDEAANGVLITENLTSPNSPGYYVNVQLGELSVANPESGATPEVLTLVPVSGDRWETVRQRYSSESPQSPLLTDDEAQALATAATEVVTHFAPLYDSTPQTCALDLEFKFLAPDRTLVVKQVRPYSSGVR